ncbi:MAG: hypothetical protein AAF787_05770 [Chloroflexota bacterium]
METDKKAKSASNDTITYLRSTFLGSKNFAIPTGLPYTESVEKLRETEWMSDKRRFVITLTDETEDSADFEIKLLQKRRARSSNYSGELRWARGFTAQGRIVRQPAFGDAMLQGEVYPPTQDVLFLSVAMLGAPVLISLWMIRGTVDVMMLAAYVILGTWVWFSISRRRRAMLDYLQKLFVIDTIKPD